MSASDWLFLTGGLIAYHLCLLYTGNAVIFNSGVIYTYTNLDKKINISSLFSDKHFIGDVQVFSVTEVNFFVHLVN